MKKFLAVVLLSVFMILSATGCSDSTTSQTSDKAAGDKTKKITVLADLVPHTELLEFVKPKLAQKGIELNIVSAAADGTWNSRVESGEVDAAYFEHEPYLKEWTKKITARS